MLLIHYTRKFFLTALFVLIPDIEQMHVAFNKYMVHSLLWFTIHCVSTERPLGISPKYNRHFMALSWSLVADILTQKRHVRVRPSHISQSTWQCNHTEKFPALLAFVRGNHRSPADSPPKASYAELWCFLWSAPEQTIMQTIETLVIWDTIALIMTSV